MAKKEQNEARQTARDFSRNTQQRTSQDVDRTRGFQDRASSRQGQAFDPALAGFRDAQDTGGYDPGRLPRLRETSDEMTRTGGYDTGQVHNVNANMQRYQETGGYDADPLEHLRSQGREFSESGGVDPAQLAKIRSGYEGFATTGGFDPTQEANFRRRATSGVPAIYDVLQQEAQRKRSLTGGLGAGGEISQMARQMSQQQSKAATGAEVDLAEQKRSGMLAGLGGLRGTETDVAGLRQSGARAAGEFESDVASGRRQLLGQESDFASQVASGVRSGAGMQQGLEGSVAQGRLQGSAGLAKLVDSTTGEVNEQGRQVLDYLGLNDLDQRTATQILQQLSNTPGIFDNIIRAAGAAGGILGGVGAVIGGRPAAGAGRRP